MKKIKIIIYECEYCGKYYKRKHFCIRHEKQCGSNPNNHHACYDCDNLIVERGEYLDDRCDSRYNATKTFYCKKRDIFMHTCKAEARGFSGKLKTERMPLKCEHHKYNGIEDNEDILFEIKGGK